MPPLQKKRRAAAPFLKWAGGKRQLIPALSLLFPAELKAKKIKTYCEPFLGGGALFFHLVPQDFGIKRAVLLDTNPELVVAWNVVQRELQALLKALARHSKRHLSKSLEGRREDYLKQRLRFNQERIGFPYERWNKVWIERAAQFLFLNRTGYNGLWRVNASGECNVPFGKYTNPRIYDAEGLRASAKALNQIQVDIRLGDFNAINEYASKSTFVYYDPPYRPLTPSATFNHYTAKGFSDQEQSRLAHFFGKMGARGTLQMLSNSDPHNIDPQDDFFEDLYGPQGGHFYRVAARRSINSKGGLRGNIQELVITNYKV